MAVTVRPRDLYHEKGEIFFKVQVDTSQKQEDDVAQIDETVKMFKTQIVINKKANIRNKVLYIETIAFLMQTLQIRVQFSHFLKFASFAHHASKILKKSVTTKHYIFDSDDQFAGFDIPGEERRSAQPRMT